MPDPYEIPQQPSGMEAIEQEQEDTSKGILGDTDFQNTYDSGEVAQELDQGSFFKEGETYVTPSSTVAGQLTSLLDTDSKYIQQARISAAEKAQERGMLNTSLAAGAGEQAAIQSALPIAQQDAQTYATAQGQQQTYEYEVGKSQSTAIMSAKMVEAEAQIARQQEAYSNAFTSAMTQADYEQQGWLKEVDLAHSKEMLDLTALQEQLLSNVQYDLATKQEMYASTSSIMQNYQISVENLMTDPDFLNLGAESVNKAINEMQTLARNSVMFVGNAQGIDLTPLVEEYLGDITVM